MHHRHAPRRQRLRRKRAALAAEENSPVAAGAAEAGAAAVGAAAAGAAEVGMNGLARYSGEVPLDQPGPFRYRGCTAEPSAARQPCRTRAGDLPAGACRHDQRRPALSPGRHEPVLR